MLRRLIDGMCAVCLTLAAILMVVIAGLILGQTVGRLAGVVIPSAAEFAGFSVAMVILLASAPTLRSGGHIRVTLIIRGLSTRVEAMLETVVLAGASGLTLLFGWFLTGTALRSFELGEVSPGLVPLPIWMPQAVMAVGAWALAIVVIEAFVDRLSGRPPAHTVGETVEGEVPAVDRDPSTPAASAPGHRAMGE